MKEFYSKPSETHKKYLFCAKCKIIKPERSHHCSICQKCYNKMDHHCPWVGNCVGFNNHKFFYMFLFWSAITLLYVLLTMLNEFIEMIKNPGKQSAVFF